VEAISEYKKVLAINQANKYSIYQIAKLYTQNCDFYGSADHIDKYKDIVDSELSDSLRIINTVNFVALNEQRMAISELENIMSSFLADKKVHYLDLIEANFPIKQKKRSIAVISSLIPGGGYFYSGYTQTGISAIILDSLLGYLTYRSIDKNNDEAYVYGLLTAVFYLGSIYGSIQTVDKYNKKNKKRILRKFRMEEL
jgi:hypothetical protein